MLALLKGDTGRTLYYRNRQAAGQETYRGAAHVPEVLKVGSPGLELHDGRAFSFLWRENKRQHEGGATMMQLWRFS